MKIALAQINPKVGDFAGNMTKIERALDEATGRGAKLAVFSEMAITGYPPKDLLNQNRFVSENLSCLDRLVPKTKRISAIVGYVRPNPRSEGRPLQNVAALMSDGEIVSTHVKTLLPSYAEFDELSYFEPADVVSVVDFNGLKLGISICEDICNPADFRLKRALASDPVTEQVKAGAEVIINIAATPFRLGMRQERSQKLVEVARRHSRPVVFVNQVGGNDELVFDGVSLAFGPSGRLLGRCRELAEDLVVVDIEAGSGEVRDTAANDEAALLDALTLGVRDFASKSGFGSALLGLCGGVDSALVAAIAARALGPENVHGVAMTSMHSPSNSLADARSLAESLKINFRVLDIGNACDACSKTLAPVLRGSPDDAAEEHIRAVLLMTLSRELGHLLLSTGNRSEIATGRAVLCGETAGGLSVISDIPKTLVFRLAEELNRQSFAIPRAIIDRGSSAELKPAPNGKDALPPYENLDPILDRLLDQGIGVETIIAEGFDEQLVRTVADKVRASELGRRQAPPGLKVISAGSVRNMPLAHGWRYES